MTYELIINGAIINKQEADRNTDVHPLDLFDIPDSVYHEMEAFYDGIHTGWNATIEGITYEVKRLV